MFGLFLQTDQTFRLPSKAVPLSNYPQLCSGRSSLWPDLLPQVDQVLPILSKPKSGMTNVPYFLPMKPVGALLQPTSLEDSSEFCLVFFPDPGTPPETTPIVKEYWSTIKPAVVCRDISGYYIGLLEDTNRCLFIRSEANGDCWLKKPSSGFSEYLSFGPGDFTDERVYIKRLSRL